MKAFRRSRTASIRPVLLLLLIACAACSPSTAQTDTTPVPNDPSLLLAQAQQADAPALALTGSGLVAAWVGGDARGIHQDARRITGDTLGDSLTLPLPPTYPYAQTLVAGLPGQTHLLWLDADANRQTTLYSALLASDLSVIRGPVSVSEGLALDYSAVSDGAGGLWAAWSGGRVAEMTISVRRSDNEGRPLLQTTPIAAGEYPAIVRALDGGIWLFWLGSGELHRQRLDIASEMQTLTGTISLAPGDQLVNVRAAADATGAYFFWNVTRADGISETWWTAGALSASAWRQPQRLTDETGNMMYRVSPASFSALAAAASSDAGVGILTFSSGRVTGYKLVLPGVNLIGMPVLAADADANYALAWSAPGTTSADLRLLTIPR